MASGRIRFELIDGDAERLMRWDASGAPRLRDPDKGSWHALLRRVQDSYERVGRKHFASISLDDLKRGARWWSRGSNGRCGVGGWQREFPMLSLRRVYDFDTVAPLFSGQPTTPESSLSGAYTYIKRFVGRDYCKIGRGKAYRARQVRATDNPDGYTILLIEEHSTMASAAEYERRLFARFARHHVEGEKYMLHPEIEKFVASRAKAQGGRLPERLRRTEKRAGA